MKQRFPFIAGICAVLLFATTPAIALMQSRELSWSHQISTASSFPGDEPDEPADELVWVCKLVGPPGNPQLQGGQNPIRVSSNATSEGHMNDAHGSPVVPAGADCDDYWPPAESAESASDESGIDEDNERDDKREDQHNDEGDYGDKTDEEDAEQEEYEASNRTDEEPVDNEEHEDVGNPDEDAADKQEDEGQ